MARSYETHFLASPVADAHQQVATASSTVLAGNCVAVILDARTQDMFVTFDNTAPSATNGIVVKAGAQPLYVPLGYHAHVDHIIRAVEAAATGFLDILQLA